MTRTLRSNTSFNNLRCVYWDCSPSDIFYFSPELKVLLCHRHGGSDGWRLSIFKPRRDACLITGHINKPCLNVTARGTARWLREGGIERRVFLICSNQQRRVLIISENIQISALTVPAFH
ncbi:uncharacterized [Tachysurus ichikawai]